MIMRAKSSMTNVVSALTARTQFGQIIRRATQKNERFVVGRRGEPSVVIMSMNDYINTFAPAPEELRDMQATAKRTGADKLTPGQINRIVAAVRKEKKNSTAIRHAK
jgi:prevent-host-death family protein